MNERDLELIRDYLDDRISPDGLERLNQLMETDADVRAEFRAMATLEEGLRDFSVVSEVPFPDHETLSAEPEREKRKHWYRAEHVGIAALFAACLVLAIMLWSKADREDEWGDAIARIEFLSEDVAFGPNQQLHNTEGSLLGKGWVQLESGRVRILFRSGATVEFEGPATLGIDTPLRAYLDFGKVAVHAPESARDFVIATESMEVVDLGTRFEVGVDPQSGESNVFVSEGRVDLHLGSPGAKRRIRPLEAGCAARVDAFGNIVEISNDGGTNQKAVPQILAHWTFDELSDNGEVENSTGNQLNGKLSAGTQPELVPGLDGQALAFKNNVAIDKNNVSIDLSEHVSTLSQLNDFTFAAWVRDPAEPLAMLFSISDDSEQHRVQFYVSPGHVYYGWQDGLHYDSISGRVDGWESKRWYHLAVSVQGGVVRLYRDGEMIGSGSVGAKIGTPVSNPSFVKNASHAYLGRLKDGRQGEQLKGQWFKGDLDDVQIYSGALSQKGIRFIIDHPGTSWSPGEPLK